MDPVSAALAAAGLITNLAGKSSANRIAGENMAQQQQALAFQRQNLIDALNAARETQSQRMEVAGAPRFDQFGNMTAYDPTQGRWVTTFTPTQQRLIAGGQAQQERAQARSAQAAEDYAQQRAGYLYKQPKTEDQLRAEIVNLISQARGEGDRALANMVQRQELRQSGNLPVIYSAQTALAPGPGQRLAETMLQARKEALSERGQLVKQHQEEYLPGMSAFEKTAQYVEPESPTGAGIAGMAGAGSSDILKALGDYGKEVSGIYGTGGKGVESAYQGIGQAGQTGAITAGTVPQLGQFASLINALKGKPLTAAQLKAQQAEGTTGGTTGATYSSAPDYSTTATPTLFGGTNVPYIGQNVEGVGSNPQWFF